MAYPPLTGPSPARVQEIVYFSSWKKASSYWLCTLCCSYVVWWTWSSPPPLRHIRDPPTPTRTCFHYFVHSSKQSSISTHSATTPFNHGTAYQRRWLLLLCLPSPLRGDSEKPSWVKYCSAFHFHWFLFLAVCCLCHPLSPWWGFALVMYYIVGHYKFD